MMRNTVEFKRWLLAVICLAGFPVWSADTESLTADVDALNKAIVESRALSKKTDVTIEELRQDLYRIAVATRDAKRSADELDQLRERGLIVDVELAQLRGDIVNAGILLRDLRDRIDILAQISQSTQQIIDGYIVDLERLRNAIIDPELAIASAGSELVASLQTQLTGVRSLVSEKDKTIERLTRENKALKASGPGPGRVQVKTAQGYEAILARAFDELASAKIDEAALSFKKALVQNPDSEDARTGLAACHFERAEYDDARRLVDEVLGRDDKNARALGLRGALSYREGNLRDARRNLERAIKSDSENPYNLNYLGIVLHELGRHEAAIKQVQKAVDIDPEYISALYNLSILLATDRNPDLIRAQSYYERAISLGGPRNPTLDQLLGIKAPTSK